MALFQELESIGFENNIDLTTHEIPVEYETVSSLIPVLWQKHKPQVKRSQGHVYCLKNFDH